MYVSWWHWELQCHGQAESRLPKVEGAVRQKKEVVRFRMQFIVDLWTEVCLGQQLDSTYPPQSRRKKFKCEARQRWAVASWNAP